MSKESETSTFPLLIREGSKFVLVSKPSDLPIGKPFVVWETNSSTRELALAEKAFGAGYSIADER